MIAIGWPAGCASAPDGGCKRPSPRARDGASARAGDGRPAGRPTRRAWVAGSTLRPFAL